MSERRLFILVEGNDDERFFTSIIIPLLSPRYRAVRLIKYACMRSNRVCRFIRSIHRAGDELLLVTDIDKAPGVAAKKHIIMERFGVIQQGEIMVIIQEIESWYLAGLELEDAQRLGVRPLHSTDQVTKEIFNTSIPPQYTSRIAYMIEILSRFSISSACRKNRSFHHFMNRYYLDCGVTPDDAATEILVKREEGSGEGSGMNTPQDARNTEDGKDTSRGKSPLWDHL